MRAVGVLLLVGTVARAASITVGPYVQDASASGFTVVFETDQPARGLVTVKNGGTVAETAGTHHESRIVGLSAATSYAYEVQLDGQPAAKSETRTLPAHDPLTFVVYGDTRQGGAVEQAIAQRIQGDAPDLMFNTGDYVRKGDDEAAWRDLFTNERELLSHIAMFPVFGNHEKWGDPGAEYTRRFLPPLRERRYYVLTVAGCAFIVLDGNTPDDATQTAWLKDQLQAARGARHVFVLVHQPPFSLGDHCGSATAQLAWVDLFEQFRVRAVFAGHDHAYERMERNGVRYFVSGGGGAPLYDEQACGDLDRAAKRRYVQEYHYLRVRVTGDQVDLTAERLEPGRPIESVRFSSHDAFVAEGPPRPSDRAAHLNPQWKYAAAGLVVLLVAGGLVRRRRAR
jgi:hypothetical protein